MFSWRRTAFDGRGAESRVPEVKETAPVLSNLDEREAIEALGPIELVRNP
jgi:hypothetical protein